MIFGFVWTWTICPQLTAMSMWKMMIDLTICATVFSYKPKSVGKGIRMPKQHGRGLFRSTKSIWRFASFRSKKRSFLSFSWQRPFGPPKSRQPELSNFVAWSVFPLPEEHPHDWCHSGQNHFHAFSWLATGAQDGHATCRTKNFGMRIVWQVDHLLSCNVPVEKGFADPSVAGMWL